MDLFTLPLFPSLVIHGRNCFDPAPLAQAAKEIQQANPEGQAFSNEGGWQKQVDIQNEIPLNAINPLIEVIEEALRERLPLKPFFTLHLDNLWFNISGPNCFNWPHSHPNAFYSGVAYLQTPKDCGNIVFINRDLDGANTGFLDSELQQRFNLYGRWMITPSAGDVLLFPATLRHKVLPNKSSEDRISVAFNLAIKDK